MNRVFVDEALELKLDELRTQAELRGRDGHLLGYFFPVAPSDREIYDWVEAQTSDEEIERRRREPGGKTTAELFEYLRTL